MESGKTRILKLGLNAVGYQAVWWTSVVGVIINQSFIGPAVLLLFLTLHFSSQPIQRSEMLLLVVAGLIGTVIDSMKSATGLIIYEGGLTTIPWLAPLWIVAMWIGFAATLNHSLGWLRGKYLVAFLLGAIFGPLAYLSGRSLGVMEFNFPTSVTIVALAIIWGTALPLLYWLHENFKVFNHAK